MLIHPLPLPDELDEGYAGFFMRINGVRSTKELDQLIRLWAGCTNKSARDVSRVELISKVAGLTVTEFVLRHTTLPLRRGITSYQSDLPHGSSKNPDMLWTTAMRAARKRAYFCEECAREDVDFHGRSYWRRSHQIPGMLWCPKHSTPLHMCEDVEAVHLAPSSLAGKPTRVDEVATRKAMDTKTIVRYLEICDGLMDRAKPLSVDHVSAVLCRQGISRGFQTYAGRVRAPLLSDAVIAQCGREWLSEVLPTLANKPENESMTKMDGVFYMKTSASTTVAYALACAVLFDNAEDALNALASPLTGDSFTRSRRKIDIDPTALEVAYLDAQGSHAKVAKKFGIAPASTANRLNKQGLPNLSETKCKSPKTALSAFISERKSIQESADAGGITVQELENVLRVMVSPPAKIILSADKERINPKPKYLRQTDQALYQAVQQEC